MVKIYAASQTPRIYGSGAGTLDTTPFLLFDETLPAIASPTTLGYGEHVELTSPVTVGLPNPRKGARLVIRNMSGEYSSVAAGSILYKGDTYTSLDFDTNTVALLKVIDGVWTASFVSEDVFFFPIVATGGTVTEFTDPETGITYRVHSFTSVGSSTFTVSSLGTTSGEVEYLVVAGGGGTGASWSVGGGGGGGFIEGAAAIEPQVYTVIVGAGGPANNADVSNGGSSSVFGIVSPGGGRGGSYDQSGFSGGCGGGAGGGTRGGGTGSFGGNGGSTASTSSPSYPGAGGGGAGGNGGNASGGSTAGNGGSGKMSKITGEEVYYAGGGGGGGSSGGIGGIGGGGSRGQNGQDGLGGGAGGNNVNGTGGKGRGGSGIIIVRYAIAYP